MQNPYESPKAEIGPRPVKKRFTPQLDDLAFGQKMIINAIILYFVAVAVQFLLPIFSLPAILIAVGMSWVGIYKITRGLKIHWVIRILLFLTMLVPLVGLLMLLVLNRHATTRLKDAGFPVGLLGAKY